jgi:hypothetical protein
MAEAMVLLSWMVPSACISFAGLILTPYKYDTPFYDSTGNPDYGSNGASSKNPSAYSN